jgi:eukaryotic-like serine/threonine-protein kinase
MKIKNFLKLNTLGSVLTNLGIAVVALLIIAICFFFIYLPNATNHDETQTVPDLTGMKFDELEAFLSDKEFRFEVEDSVYHEEYPALTVLRQFPKPGATVKKNRIIYVSINPVMPPMVPVPDLANPNNTTSRVGAEAILKSVGLKRGRPIPRPHADLNLVLGMLYKGKPIEAGTRIPKGSLIDLLVGDGNGAKDFVLESLKGKRLSLAMFNLQGWNLRLGKIEIGYDTTGSDPIVYKTWPEPGDSVRVGDQIDLYICPPDHVPEEELEAADSLEINP